MMKPSWKKRHDRKGPENPEIFNFDSDKVDPGLDFTKKIEIHNAAITDTGWTRDYLNPALRITV